MLAHRQRLYSHIGCSGRERNGAGESGAARLAAGGRMGYSQVAKRQGGQERVARQRADVVVRHVPETITTTSHTSNYLSKSSINISKYFDNVPSIKSWLCTYVHKSI